MARRRLSWGIWFLATAAMCCCWRTASGQQIGGLTDYVGLYVAEKTPGALDSVYEEWGRLWMESAAFPREELKATGRDRFVFVGEGDPDKGKSVLFERDAQGKVAKLSIARPNGTTSAPEVRTSDHPKRLNAALRYVRSEVMIPMRDGAKLHAAFPDAADAVWRG